MLTIDANGRPHTNISGPRLVSPNNVASKTLTLGNAGIPLRVKLQPNKGTWRLLAKRQAVKTSSR